MKPIKIAILCDQLLLGIGIEKMVNSISNASTQLVTTSSARLIESFKLKKNFADIIIFYQSLDEFNQLKLMKEITDSIPETKIIVVTANFGDQYIGGMLEMGIRGFISTLIEFEKFESVIQKVYTNGRCFSNEVIRLMVDILQKKNYLKKNRQDKFKLTNSDKLVLKLICEQKKDSEIAKTLNRGLGTISMYKSTLRRKFGVENNIGLVIFAIKNNIVRI